MSNAWFCTDYYIVLYCMVLNCWFGWVHFSARYLISQPAPMVILHIQHPISQPLGQYLAIQLTPNALLEEQKNK